ncbi:acyl-CoA dehydrogenase family protein [Mycobacterium sp.]|uniref:acyl-CoA dehydrogenase family protein n=1 Tax=Mycobacterium sp. TaxID=1785 RepID=UPI0031DF9C78
MMDVSSFKSANTPADHRASYPSPIAQVYPPFALDAATSASWYRHLESGRGVNYFTADPNLARTLATYLPATVRRWAEKPLSQLGERAGNELVRRADVYDATGHVLTRYDKLGRDVSRVEHHPDWLANLDEVFDYGLVGWNHDPARLQRYGRAPVPLLAAFDYLVGQADMALCCPLELAHGTVAVVERFATAEQRDELLPAIVATRADQRLQVAQVATEITGGSDVGATRTEAHHDAVTGRWVLTGEKWFASNVGADLIVTLARVDPDVAGTKGLAMFVVPRIRHDGAPNGVSVRRLKDKMGTIGVPTGELLFTDADAILIGEPDKGFAYMAEMLNHTRFWNAVGSVGIMRRSLLEAATYTARRASFGTTLDSFPMMRERLIWLEVDLTATLSLLMHTAHALESAETGNDDGDALRFRTLAPVIKYRSGEQCVDFARAAIEMMGANGYIANFGTPKLLRDAQVNPIWEGTSNICALDLWRAITRQHGHEPVLNHCEQVIATLVTEPARRVGEAALHAIKDSREAITSLAGASRARQDQQARRLTDLLGDTVAVTAMAAEIDTDVRTDGDHRKAILAELFTRRMVTAHTRRSAVIAESVGVPELFAILFNGGIVDASLYRTALSTLETAADR